MGRIVWSHPAKDDLKEIVSYIHAESPAYAKSFALRLHERIIQLENFPNSGRLVPNERDLKRDKSMSVKPFVVCKSY